MGFTWCIRKPPPSDRAIHPCYETTWVASGAENCCCKEIAFLVKQRNGNRILIALRHPMQGEVGHCRY